MHSQKIQVVSPQGSLITTHFVEDPQSDPKSLFDGFLFEVTDDKLVEFSPENKICNTTKRFVLTQNEEEKSLIKSMELIKFYLRFPDKKGVLIKANPYASFSWLISRAETLNQGPVKLYLNGKLLTSSGDSLIGHIYDKAIIHILPATKSQNTLKQIYLMGPVPKKTSYQIKDVNLSQQVYLLKKKASQLTGVVPVNLHLIFGGRIMKENDRLADYHLAQNSIVYVANEQESVKAINLNQWEQIKKKYNQFSEKGSLLSGSKQISKASANCGRRVKEMEQEQFFDADTQMQMESAEMTAFKNIDEKKLKEKFELNQPRAKDNTVEESQQKIVEKDGTETIKKIKITRNFQNQIIEEQIIEISTKMDEEGNIHKVTTRTIIESEKITEVTSQKIDDKEGQNIMTNIDTVEKQKQKNGHVHEHSHDVMKMEKTGYEIQIEKDRVSDEKGCTIRQETNVAYTKSFEDGKICRFQEISIEENEMKSKTSVNIRADQNGAITSIKKVETNSQKLPSGLMHTHQKQESKDRHSVKTVEKDYVQGENNTEKIQSDENTFEETPDGNVRSFIKHSVKEGTRGRQIQEDIDLNKGRVSMKQGKQQQKQNSTDYHQIEVSQETITTVYGEVRKQKSQEEITSSHGAVHRRKTSSVEQNEEIHTKLYDENYDEKGQLVSEHIEEIDITKDKNHHVHQHKVQIDIVDKKVHTHIVDTETDEIGNIIKQENSDIDAEDKAGSLVEINEKNTNKSEEIITNKEQLKIQDKEGHVITSKMHEDQTKIDKKKEMTQEDLEIAEQERQKREIDELLCEDDDRVISKEREMVEDDNHLIHIHEREVREEHGKYINIERDETDDPNGNKIREQTSYSIDQLGKDNKIHHINTHIISENHKLKIETDDYEEDQKGNLHCVEHYDKVINEDSKGDLYQISVDAVENKIGYHVRREQKELNQRGQVISEKITEKEEPSLQGMCPLSESINIEKGKPFQNFLALQQQAKITNSYSLDGSADINDKIRKNSSDIKKECLNKVAEADQILFDSTYNIKVKELNGNEWNLQINADDNVDDIAQKFSDLTGFDKQRLKFFANGEEVMQYDMAEEIGVLNDLAIYVEIKGQE